MHIEAADNYEELCETFQYRVAQAIKEALAKYGVAPDIAKEICGDAVFDISMLFDQDLLEVDGQSYRAVLAFSEDTEEETYILDDGVLCMHEYAFGTVDQVYEESSL